MYSDQLVSIALCLLMAGAFTLTNYLTSWTPLKWFTMAGLVFFLTVAAVFAVRMILKVGYV